MKQAQRGTLQARLPELRDRSAHSDSPRPTPAPLSETTPGRELSSTATVDGVLASRRSDGREPKVVVLDPDPYLAFLVRSTFPDAQIVTLSDAEMLGGLAGRVDLAVVDLDTPGVSRFLARQPGLRVLGIGDSTRMAATAQPCNLVDLVLRPFDPAELAAALRHAAGVDDAGAAHQELHQRLLTWLMTARAATAVLATLAQLAMRGISGPGAVVIPAVLVYVSLTLLIRRRSDLWSLADLGVATVAIALTGGITSPYGAFGIVAVAATALTVGSLTGALCGLIPIVWPLLMLAEAGGRSASSAHLVGLLGLFPLASLTGAVLGHVGRRSSHPGAELAAEANRVLSSLFRIARTVPGGFDLNAVASAALEEARNASGSPAGLLLLREAGIVRVAGFFGVPGIEDTAFAEDSVRDDVLFGSEPSALPAGALPRSMDVADAHPCWICSPLRTEGVAVGTLLTACTDCTQHAGSLRALAGVAHETALAVNNARLFAQVQVLSANEERRRLGRELHDGLAQALVHLRLELEMLATPASSGGAGFQSEAARLARVAAGALDDLHSTIKDLRTQPTGGLAGALSAYLRDIRSLGGPQIDFVVSGDCTLSTHVEAEMFRVAQEAVSNALRHASASLITVTLAPRGSGIALIVDDNGRGIGTGAAAGARPSSGIGVGLQSMKERARRLGGRLTISSGNAEGTRIELVVEGEAPRRSQGGQPLHLAQGQGAVA